MDGPRKGVLDWLGWGSVPTPTLGMLSIIHKTHWAQSTGHMMDQGCTTLWSFPLPRAGGVCRSVRPARHGALLFRGCLGQAFTEHTQLTLSLKRQGSEPKKVILQCGPEQSPTTLMPSLELQADTTQPSNKASAHWPYKLGSWHLSRCRLMWDFLRADIPPGPKDPKKKRERERKVVIQWWIRYGWKIKTIVYVNLEVGMWFSNFIILSKLKSGSQEMWNAKCKSLKYSLISSLGGWSVMHALI